jgi:hypothetical protein
MIQCAVASTLGLRAGKPRPVAVVTQRVGLKEIGRVAIGVQRLQAAILAEQRRAG